MQVRDGRLLTTKWKVWRAGEAERAALTLLARGRSGACQWPWRPVCAGGEYTAPAGEHGEERALHPGEDLFQSDADGLVDGLPGFVACRR